MNTISVGSDPTSAEVRAGRIAFSAARASTSGTFSCESCHPNANIDQILWTINTDLAPGDPCGGADVCPEPRSTMPIRGLRDTLPLHWAGNLADPFSGLGVGGPEDPVAPDCDIAVVGENGCIRHLVDASLSGVMCDPASCPVGPAGLPGALTDQERDDMAAFMGAVSFPPSPTRRPTDVLSASALQGADDFFTDQGGNLLATCADSTSGCHSLPLTVSTNSATVGGFDAPSIRGLWDRSITFSNGLTSSEEQLTAQGFDPKPGGMSEFGSLAATFPTLFTVGYNVPVDDIWSFINEMSVGLPGLTGRQIVLTAANANDPGVAARLTQMEAAADEGRVSAVARVVKSTYVFDGGVWVPRRGQSLTTAELRAVPAQIGLPLVVTAHLPETLSAGGAARQPLLAPDPPDVISGAPNLPVVNGGALGFTVASQYVDPDASVLLDGVVCGGCSLVLGAGTATITLDSAPSGGLHIVQLLNPRGFASNELPICSGASLGSC